MLLYVELFSWEQTHSVCRVLNVIVQQGLSFNLKQHLPSRRNRKKCWGKKAYRTNTTRLHWVQGVVSFYMHPLKFFLPYISVHWGLLTAACQDPARRSRYESVWTAAVSDLLKKEDISLGFHTLLSRATGALLCRIDQHDRFSLHLLFHSVLV